MLKKVWYLLISEHQLLAVGLCGLMFLGMMMETLGIGLVVPALAIITQSNLTENYPILLPWLEKMGNPSHERLVVVAMLALVSVYFIKTSFLAFLAWRQAQFTSNIQANLSQRLFSGYLHQPYTFHLQHNSAQLIRNTINHAGTIAGALQQSFLMAMEVLVMLGISIMLVVVEPLGAILVTILFGLTGWVFNRFTRKHILRWGEDSQLHEKFRIQHIQQGLGGAKDVKLLGRESDFLDRFDIHNIGCAKINQRVSTLQVLPRMMLELLTVTSLAFLVIVMISQDKPIESLVPTIALFAVAAFRLLPSVNRMMGAVQYLRFAKPVIDTMYDEIRLINNTKPSTYSGALILKDKLTLTQVGFSYPSTESPVLQEIDLTIPHGSTIGFIGYSGAGKSTLVDIILGLLTPVLGTVKVDGVDIQTSIRGWQDQIGYVPQSIYLTDDNLRCNIAFGLPDSQINDNAVWDAVKAAQLDQFINDLPDGLETVVGERGIRLSGGQRQRIGIARALYHDPSVLVLDEATSSLDTDTERGVMEAVCDLHGKKTILIVAHRLSTVENCDYLYRLEQGQVVEAGPPGKILFKKANKTEVKVR